MSIGIVWIRDDFRLENNSALIHASRNHNTVSAIYIYNNDENMMTNQPTRTTNLQGLQKSLQKEGLGLKVRTECGELGAISSQMFEVLLKLRKNDPTSVENIVMIVAMMKRLQVLTRRGRKEKQEKYRSRKRKQVV